MTLEEVEKVTEDSVVVECKKDEKIGNFFIMKETGDYSHHLWQKPEYLKAKILKLLDFCKNG